ncbi:MAG: hypothetical protein ACREIF_11050 [Chthoniobacterales bacterium]
MKTKKYIVCCLTALLALPVLEVFAGAPADSVQLINTFDYPSGSVSTQPQKINDYGAVVGVFADVNGIQYGFVRFQNGHFSAPLVDPDDGAGLTQGRGINNSSRVCGNFVDVNGAEHGFFLRGATFYNYDVAGSSFTIVLGINNVDDFCGSDVPSSGVQSGFVSIGGTLTEFTVGGAATLAYQINSSDQAAGYYIDSSSITHGYYRDSDGSIVAPIDPAGSTGTIVFGNNDSNTIVGRYSDSAGLTHGFVFIPPSTYVLYDYPGSVFTSLNGISAQGRIVGRYQDNNGIQHGLLARLVSGSSDGATITGTIPQRQSSQAGSVRPLPARAVEEPAF